MANATVETLKDLGLRHGEKAVVGLAAVLCVVFAALAMTKQTIDLTPDEVKRTAEQAEANLNKKQSEEEILSRLQDDFLKEPVFAQLVANQQSHSINPGDYAFNRDWVLPEPGAGLIRDQPELIAPSELYARGGRGGALVFALDAQGQRILAGLDEDDEPAPPRRRPATRGGRTGPGGGFPLPGGTGPAGAGGFPGAGGRDARKAEEEAQRKYEEEQRRRDRALIGRVDEAEDEAEARDLPFGRRGDEKEVVRGLRWVAVTGVFDHKRQRELYARALRVELARAHPNYIRLDLQRQELQDNDSWSDWHGVDLETNIDILDNLPTVETELTPSSVRLSALVDRLPFLQSGEYRGVHIANLVPPEERRLPEPTRATAGRFGAMGGGYGSMMAGMADMMGGGYPGMAGMMPGGGGYGGSGMPERMEMMLGSGGYPGMMGGMEMMGGMGMMGGGAGRAEDLNFEKTEADQVMTRSLDFTVEPDSIYRYRVRIVVRNPNWRREDVSPRADNESQFLFGPWSEPTNIVTVPADVTAYAVRPRPNSSFEQAGTANPVQFQVARWNEEEGITVVVPVQAGPGQLVGRHRSAQVPSIEGEGVRNRGIDFNTRQLVLDTMGGAVPLAPVGVDQPLEFPALALLLRPDGTVVVRDQARDLHDPDMREMRTTYDHAIRDSLRKREPGRSNYEEMMRGMGMPGMMGGYPGGMMPPGMQPPGGGSGGRGRR